MSKKTNYILEDLDWLEAKIKDIRAYVDNHPFETLTDRTEIVMSAKGTPVIKITATIEAQNRELRAMLKDYFSWLPEINRLRMERAESQVEIRGGGEMSGIMKNRS
jgi:hypothetical protein